MKRSLMPAVQRELYDTQDACLVPGMAFTDIVAVRRYLDRLIDQEWFFDLWPFVVNYDAERRGSGAVWSTQEAHAHDERGRCTHGTLLLTKGGMTQSTVLHETAHLLTPDNIGHGPLFAETQLTLIRHEMGFQAFADYYQGLRRTETFRYIREGISA